MKTIGSYWQSVIPLLATIAASVLPLLTGDHTANDWVNVVILGLGTVAAWVAVNTRETVARWTKEIISALMAGAVLLSSLVSDGISRDEWKQVGIAVVMALLVTFKKNTDYQRAVIPGEHRAVG